MTQQPGTQSTDDLAIYRARESALYHVGEALAAADSWDAFRKELERRGLPEVRVQQVVAAPVPMDLHLHSTCSDGQVPPRKLAWLARVMGLRTIALADHDSIDGTRELYAEATLLGVTVIPAVELATGQPGLEVLLYFPDAGRFFDFLTSAAGRRFLKYLRQKQEAVHEETLRVLASVNRWLKRRGVEADQAVTEDELDAFFGGRKPYYPGTLCVLGLKRLSGELREKLGIHDPRTFNTKVVTPALKRLRGGRAHEADLDQAVDDVRKHVAAIRRAGVDCAAVLSHPKELATKGRMSLGKVAKTVERLVERIGLDGVEIGCARDDEDDVRLWREIVDEVNAKIASGELDAPGPLIVASYTSDFHVLAPGLATGEITLGFGLLDERPGHRRGNLRPQTTPEELLEALRRRAAVRAKS